MVAPLYVVRYRTLLCFKDFFAVDEGSDDVGLCHLLNIVVQEVTIEDSHVGYFAELDGAQTVLLMELVCNIDGHGTQRLLTGNSFLRIAWRGGDAI